MPPRPTDTPLLRRFPSLSRHAAICLAAAGGSAAIILIQTQFLATGLAALTDGDATALTPLVIGLVLVGVGRAGLRAITDWSSSQAMTTVRAGATRAVLARADALDEAGAAATSPARLSALVTSGIDAIDPWIRSYLPAVCTAAIVPAVVGLRIAIEDWISAAILLFAVSAIPVFMVLIGRYTDVRQRREWATMQRLGAHFHDVLSGMETLRLFGRAEAQVEGVHTVAKRYRVSIMSTLRVAFLSAFALELLATLSVALVAVTAGVRLSGGSMTLSSALVVLLLAPECSLPLRKVGAAFHASMAGADAAEDLDEFDALSASPDGAEPRPTDARGDVDVTGLSILSERGVRTPAVSFTARAGSITALVGPSGSGKSTVVAALAGQVRPTEGSIRIAGIEVAALGRSARRSLITVVHQRPVPVGSTLLDSARLANPRASDSDTVDALAALGLGAAVGGPGVERAPHTLSGGEQQRLGVARSLLASQRREPAVIALVDEPTAHLDTASSDLVIAALRSMADNNVTVIVATHDPALIDAASQVVAIGAAGDADARSFEPTVPPASTSPGSASPPPEVDQPVRVPRPRLLPEAVAGEATTLEQSLHSAAGSDAISLRTRVTNVVWFRRLAPISRRLLVQARGLGMLAEGCTLGLAVAAAWLIFRAAEQPSFADLAVVAVGVRGFGVGKGVFRYAERLASHDAVFSQLGTIRAAVVQRLSKLVPAAIAPERRGAVISSTISDVDRLGDLELRVIGPALSAAFATAIAIAGVAVLSGPAAIALTLGAMLAGVAAPAVVAARSSSGTAQIAHLKVELAAATAHYGELVTTLGAADAAGPIHREICALSDRIAVLDARRNAVSAWAAGLIAGLGAWTAASAAALVGAVGPGEGPVLGVAVLVPFAVIELLSPSVNGAEVLGSIAGSATRLRALLELPDPTPEPSASRERDQATQRLHHGTPTVALDRVTLAWHPSSPVVSSLSMRVTAQQRLMIRGRSGSGKSTLAAGLVAFIRPTSGTYDISGVDTELVHSDEVRREVLWAPQDPWLASTSIRENLRIVDPAATDDAMWNALRSVDLATWVQSLPQALDTELGVGSMELSGGQRQRLALARVVLAQHRTVVLDEPTAHLDADTSAATLNGLLDEMLDRSVVMITHDDTALAALSDAQTITLGPEG